ncbi:MAG: type II toxin-antitoxin system RelE/ParE family toxin [Proteobacteria bacterium]|jgi:mRNA interferase RelE/StbE|nr:type II toxin-antitoxin system RelE/ParE family toxin [Pseudomonadota bacterium]
MNRSGPNLSFVLKYHPEVRNKDIIKLNADIKERIKKAIETRLVNAPQQYGAPLRKTLKGYWKLRVGDYRVVFKIQDTEILILGICHRKEVYKIVKVRIKNEDNT